MTDIFYGLRSLHHRYTYNVGAKSILKNGIKPADLTPDDARYFAQLNAEQQRLLTNEQKALAELASAQNTYAQREALWNQYAALNESAGTFRLSAKLDRQISAAKNRSLIDEKRRTAAELLEANRQANEAMRWRTVDTTAQATNQTQQQEQSWGGV